MRASWWLGRVTFLLVCSHARLVWSLDSASNPWDAARFLASGEQEVKCNSLHPDEAIAGCPFDAGRKSPCIPGSSCFDYSEPSDRCQGPENEGFFGQCCDEDDQCESSTLSSSLFCEALADIMKRCSKFCCCANETTLYSQDFAIMISELVLLLVERITSALSARLRDCSQPASRKTAVITKAFVMPEVALMRADMDTVQDASVSLPMRNVKVK